MDKNHSIADSWYWFLIGGVVAMAITAASPPLVIIGVAGLVSIVTGIIGAIMAAVRSARETPEEKVARIEEREARMAANDSDDDGKPKDWTGMGL